MLEVYDRLTAQRSTINQLNRLHTVLESSLTPLEVLELNARLLEEEDYWQRAGRANTVLDLAQFRQTTQRWVLKLLGFHHLSGKPEAEAFHREELMPAVTRFRSVDEPQGRSLVVCLCGNSPVPMMPTPSLLQALDVRHVDFVLVRELRMNGYRLGIEGLGETFDELLEALPRLLGVHQYPGHAYIGLSGGGLPALMLALATRASAAISVGGNAPSDPRWVRKDGATAADLLSELAVGARLPRISLLFGQHSLDRPAAEGVAAILPATLHEISDPPHEVGHNAFFPLLRSGRMRRFLVENLGLPA